MDDAEALGLAVAVAFAAASFAALVAFARVSAAEDVALSVVFLAVLVAVSDAESVVELAFGVAVALGVALEDDVFADEDDVVLLTPSRLFSASPTPSGSSGFVVELAEADADGVEVAVGVLVLPPPEDDELFVDELADGVGVAVALLLLVPSLEDDEDFEDELALELDEDADGVADSSGVSEHDVPEKGFFGSSSADARRGVSPMPMSTAVGMAAMAIALPAGTCSLVSSDFLGAAWRGPVLTRGPPPTVTSAC
ncbi:hypothetical protein ACFXJ5_29710 [Streptomyces sp. NPDC059373]